MEEERKKVDYMDIEQSGGPSYPSTVYGSPSYDPPEPEEYTEKRKAKGEHDETEEEDNEKASEPHDRTQGEAQASSSEEDAEDGEARAARRKAKGKARAYSPIEDDNSDKEYPHEILGTAKRSPFASHPTAAQDNSVDTDNYWAGSGNEMQFGDADAVMNDMFTSQPSSDNEDNSGYQPFTTPAFNNPLSEGHNPAKLDTSGLVDRLSALQQEGVNADGGWGRGMGRGRGKGIGWGLEWKETMTQQQVEREGWASLEDLDPSPEMQAVGEDVEWEEYDPVAWERAAERAQKQDAGKVTFKVPPSSTVGESTKHATAKDEGHGGEFVRAVKDYKAILKGNYLSYEKDDVMRVIYRDRDGKHFTLLPFKAGAFPGSAHTKNFVPLDTEAGD